MLKFTFKVNAHMGKFWRGKFWQINTDEPTKLMKQKILVNLKVNFNIYRITNEKLLVNCILFAKIIKVSPQKFSCVQYHQVISHT